MELKLFLMEEHEYDITYRSRQDMFHFVISISNRLTETSAVCHTY
jgi:hypothetical protein